MSKQSIEQLRAEILQIDNDLVQLGEQEREAERGIDRLALLARRGDATAEKRIGEHEELRATAMNRRRRLQAARVAIEAELQAASAAVDWEANKERARAAKKIVATLRQRGPNIGEALRTALQEYAALQEDMASLAGLGMTRVNGELVRANCRRAFRAALTPIRAELEMTLVPPLERRAFDELTEAWCDNSERMINAILSGPEETAPPAQVVASG